MGSSEVEVKRRRSGTPREICQNPLLLLPAAGAALSFYIQPISHDKQALAGWSNLFAPLHFFLFALVGAPIWSSLVE
jgi:hypothetical protein